MASSRPIDQNYDGEHGLNAISDFSDPLNHDTGAADTECRDERG
jgi:hypothetical protein